MTEPQPTAAEEQSTTPEPSPASEPSSSALAQPAPPETQNSETQASIALQGMLTVLVVVVFMITFVVQAFRVPSESMENTLLIGDFVLADKLHFGSAAGILGKLLPYRQIQRGDIIVFHYPVDPSQYFVKRVVGLPGDRVHLRNGTVYCNGSALQENYVIHSFPYFNFYRDNFPAQAALSAEVDRKWRREMPKHLDHGDLVVPRDSYFVMGDNRDRSLDSRYWGFVPRANVLGRPLVIYMSLNETRNTERNDGDGKLVSSGSALTHLFQLARWDRVFHLVH
ncbi:MAG TPA: signal peptidase I [Terriglobales bacterium]|nr:signal peptidase I [Terriglobales bacterium]